MKKIIQLVLKENQCLINNGKMLSNYFKYQISLKYTLSMLYISKLIFNYIIFQDISYEKYWNFLIKEIDHYQRIDNSIQIANYYYQFE